MSLRGCVGGVQCGFGGYNCDSCGAGAGRSRIVASAHMWRLLRGGEVPAEAVRQVSRTIVDVSGCSLQYCCITAVSEVVVNVWCRAGNACWTCPNF